jgi:tetratricopeptide (TPR) repeat protein
MPGSASATAYHRMRKPEQALEAFEKAVEANPDDGYTRRNLGGMLIGFKRIDEAVTHLRRALDLMPDDPQAIFGLATALEQLGTREADEEADGLYLRFIEEHPNSPMAEQAEKARTAFAHRRLKSSSVGGFRPDVMMYISEALQTFKKLGPQKCRAIALEIAVLGRSGLDINDPADKYTLKSLPGKFSGLHLLAIMYTAFRQIDPTMDTGADFGAEYQAALEMQRPASPDLTLPASVPALPEPDPGRTDGPDLPSPAPRPAVVLSWSSRRVEPCVRVALPDRSCCCAHRCTPWRAGSRRRNATGWPPNCSTPSRASSRT